ncbi:hypothetical protein [Bosea beijingensis]|uniref:hypothetical protein n=1 Tax=Bosea beijingensis TaxID=3068632 RepID=UPI0027423606|nr:hypothetical protein [Bosea sp. REN20]
MILAEQQEAERLAKETRRVERIRQAEIERAAEEASRRADTAKANDLAAAAIQEARSRFEYEVRPLTERYLAAYWRTLAELTNSREWRSFKGRLAQVELADENLGAAIARMNFDPTWASGEKNRINGERAAAHQDNALISMIDAFIASGRAKASPSAAASRINLELARKPGQLYSLGDFSALYGITSQQRAVALRDFKAQIVGKLGTTFDPSAVRTVNRVWLAGIVLADTTIEVGSVKTRLGPETPDNVIAPLCEDPRFVDMVRPVVRGNDACSYRLIDLSER